MCGYGSTSCDCEVGGLIPNGSSEKRKEDVFRGHRVIDPSESRLSCRLPCLASRWAGL
jgi:hypothetical protein